MICRHLRGQGPRVLAELIHRCPEILAKRIHSAIDWGYTGRFGRSQKGPMYFGLDLSAITLSSVETVVSFYFTSCI